MQELSLSGANQLTVCDDTVFDGDTVIAVADRNDVSAAFEADSRRSAAVKVNPSLDFEERVDWWLLL